MMSSSRPAEFISCPRCAVSMQYAGTKHFGEAARAWDFLGGVFELLKERVAFDLYVCVRCGRAELFVDGIGEEFRREMAEPTSVMPPPPPPPPVPTDQEWKCPACKVSVPGNFDICWSCQRPRRESEEAAPRDALAADEVPASSAAVLETVENSKPAGTEKDSTPQAREESWECPACGARNRAGAEICWDCVAPKTPGGE